MQSLRILSLLPAATEIVYLLGLEKYLVAGHWVPDLSTLTPDILIISPYVSDIQRAVQEK